MTNNNINDHNIIEFAERKQLISTFKNRFQTYGYKQIRTSTFESYDLYSNVAGTIPQDEMIKVIDASGKVLVLRPDVTIPVTQEVARQHPNLTEVKRYFYVLDVFRQSFANNGSKERTQAGVECFGSNSVETDAEILALAIHTLNDLGTYNFKIEIGHAGFFKSLVAELNLSHSDFQKLQQFIEQKNVTEIAPFLENLNVDQHLIDALSTIPLLYGKPEDVLARLEKISLQTTINEEITYLKSVYDILKSYGIEDNVVLDLGLISHMEYYTDIIFQGFIQNISKPVLIGGRYNHLADQFDAHIPAIGFAYDVDLLLEATSNRDTPIEKSTTLAIIYNEVSKHEALQTATKLRNQNIPVTTYSSESKLSITEPAQLHMTETTHSLKKDNKTYEIQSTTELISYL